MYTFKEWLNEEIKALTVKELHRNIYDPDSEAKLHSYGLHDHKGIRVAQVTIIQHKNHGKVFIAPNYKHPDSKTVSYKSTGNTPIVGSRVHVPHHILRPALDHIVKRHPDIETFSFTRGSGSAGNSSVPGIEHKEHTVKNPHYKQE